MHGVYYVPDAVSQLRVLKIMKHTRLIWFIDLSQSNVLFMPAVLWNMMQLWQYLSCMTAITAVMSELFDRIDGNIRYEIFSPDIIQALPTKQEVWLILNTALRVVEWRTPDMAFTWIMPLHPCDLWSGQKLVNTFHYSAWTKLPPAAGPWLKITSSGNFTPLPTENYQSFRLMERNTKSRSLSNKHRE